MISVFDYQKNPCKSLSIPYWKAMKMTAPKNIKIVHDSEFNEDILKKYSDKRFFRLLHTLRDVPDFNSSEFDLKLLSENNYTELADLINKAYVHLGIRVRVDDIIGWTRSEVYCPDLWMGAFVNGELIASIICEYDEKIGEAVIEWLQVLPEYRGRGIASSLCSSALKSMKKFANFATVSGECENLTNPEKTYRKCGFEGTDIWHILTER